MPRFEEFSREASRAGRDDPMFTLQARGLISFNHATFAALGQPDAVALLYDPTDSIVAMRKVPKSHDNAYIVRKQQQAQSFVVGAQGFVGHYKISTQRARRFPGHDYGDGVWGFALQEGTVVQNRRGRRPGPPVTDRWRYTTNGVEVPELMNITHVGMSHPGYMRRQPGTQPPSVRIGMLVACSALGPKPATSELRSRFLSFLDLAPVMGVVTALSHTDAGAAWEPWGGHGRVNLEAVLTGGSEDEPPIASALLLLPEQGKSMYGRDSRFAQLVLDVDPRGPNGGPSQASSLATWHARFTDALGLPAALGRFLTDELGLTTSDDPPAQAGIWLKTTRAMTELVDVEQFRTLKGALPANQFIGWALADPGGDTVEATAVDWLTQMCDTTLRLDGYEQALDRMRAGRKDELRSGERLSAGNSLYSADGRFRFELHHDGNLIVHWGRRYLWKSDTARTRGEYHLILQEDGDLVVEDADNNALWSSRTAGTGANSLIMQTDGNLVLYSKDRPVWSSAVIAEA
jgi:hypothetical protein